MLSDCLYILEYMKLKDFQNHYLFFTNKNLKYSNTFDELFTQQNEYRMGYETIYPYFQSLSI